MQKRNPDKLPLDLPLPQVRQRRPGYRARSYERIEEIDKTASLLRKMLITAIIIVIVIVLKSINTEFTQNVVGYIRDSITEDMDIDEALGKLKFVTNFIPDTITVFGQNQDQNQDQTQDITPFFAIPAEGKVVGQFGLENKGIDILGTKNNSIYAVANGIVIDLGENKNAGQFIKIDHGNEITSLYEGCSRIDVNIGDRVIKGDKIGTMGVEASGEYALHFEAWVNNKPVNPLKLIETGK